jgi:hypothetical protein
MDFSIRRIESGPVRGPGAPQRRKEQDAPEFSLEVEPEPEPEPSDPESGESAHQPDDEAPISPKLDDEAGGRLDVTA